MSDLEAAITAVEQPRTVALAQYDLTIASSGRPARILVPADATDGELAELAGWMLTQLMAAMRTKREAAAVRPRLIVPS